MGISVITGSNRGIGLELTRQLAQKGRSVVAVCRKPSPELEALGVRVEADIDVSRPENLAELARRLGDEPVDLLINNAGILRSYGLESVTAEAVREQIDVNSIGPLLVTQALLPRLHAGSKVALVTSRMGSIGDNTSGGSYAYRMSKAALNAAGKSLAIDLQPRGVAVIILHPGFVRTEMTGRNGMVDADESARNLLARIEELTLETTGRFLHMNGEELPW